MSKYSNIKTTKWWLLVLIILIIGLCGIFWFNSLSNIEFDFKMDDNTLKSIEVLTSTATTPTCEDGCLYLIQQWIGSDFKKETANCIKHCSRIRYEKELDFNNALIPLEDIEGVKKKRTNFLRATYLMTLNNMNISECLSLMMA